MEMYGRCMHEPLDDEGSTLPGTPELETSHNPPHDKSPAHSRDGNDSVSVQISLQISQTPGLVSVHYPHFFIWLIFCACVCD